tara:strand:+ start:2165 stop:2440 length:276 start_codon:yes stop_codon:yes gene_type:complete
MSKMGNYVVGLQEGADDYIEAYKKRILKLYGDKSVAELDQTMLALRKRYDEAVRRRTETGLRSYNDEIETASIQIHNIKYAISVRQIGEMS